MSISIEAIVENGQIRLPEGAKLPEKARVLVVLPDVFDVAMPKIIHMPSTRLADPSKLAEFRVTMVKEPAK